MDDNTMHLFQLMVTALMTVGASSGFWIYMDRKRNHRNLTRKLLIGLAHDRIVCLSMKYIERGFITQDEYENLHEFLFVPYSDLGGNGSADRLMKEVQTLPIFNRSAHIEKQLKGEKDVLEQ